MVGIVESVQQLILSTLLSQVILLYQEIQLKPNVMLDNTIIFGTKIRALIVQKDSIALT